MPRLLAIGGAPATGKTTLVAELVKRCAAVGTVRKMRALEFHMAEVTNGPAQGHLIYFLGRYDPEAGEFAGTDRLSMAVHEDALYFLNGLSNADDTVVFEGDRLFCDSFLDGLQAQERLHLVLWVTPSVLAARRAARGSVNQTETFLRGRDTKYMNMIRSRGDITTVRFDTEADFERVIGLCATFIFAGRTE